MSCWVIIVVDTDIKQLEFVASELKLGHETAMRINDINICPLQMNSIELLALHI